MAKPFHGMCLFEGPLRIMLHHVFQRGLDTQAGYVAFWYYLNGLPVLALMAFVYVMGLSTLLRYQK